MFMERSTLLIFDISSYSIEKIFLKNIIEHSNYSTLENWF